MSHRSTPDDSRHAARFSPLLFHSLALVSRRRQPGRKGAPLAASVLVHSAVFVLVVLVPLLSYDALPGQDVSGFFPEPLVIAAPPPPPPPPPPSGIGRVTRQPMPVATQTQPFVAPADVSRQIEPDAFDLGPAGDPNGVVGGVPDGVGVGIVAGLPPLAPPAPTPVIRISSYAAPRLVRKVAPVYPELARAARVTGVVVVEAQVDTHGNVTAVRVVNGHPLLEAAAVEAVREWRYQPLLLSGTPTAFLVTVSINFTLNRS